MSDRNTKIRGSQFKNFDLKPEDLNATNVLGTGMDGYVPSYDEATGKFTWIAPSGHTQNTDIRIQDADGDTKVQVEESADEDKVRIDTGGTERILIDENGLKLENGADVNEFSTDGTLGGNSDDAIPTEKAVKTYVDANAGKGAKHAITRGFEISNNATDADHDIDIAPGTLYHDDSEVNKTSITTIQLDNNGDWIDGSQYSFSGGIGFAYIYVKSDGTIKFDENAPNTPDTEDNFGYSGIFNGASSYLSVPDHADWDICGSNSDDWTIDFWVKHTDHAGIENYLQQYEDASNRWRLYHQDGSGIAFVVVSVGSLIISTGLGGEITDTDWHHVALCKVADEYGCYLDGNQVNYKQGSDTDTFAGALEIGRYESGAGSKYFDGHMDEIRIQHSNVFSASPDSGKTDTITVPTSPYTSDSNTKLLLHLDNNVTDSGDTEHTVTNNNVTFEFRTIGENKYYYQDSNGDFWRIIGAVRVATDDTIDGFFQNGNKFMYDIPINLTTTLSGGSWSSLDCSNAIPNISNLGIFGLYVDESSVSGDPATVWIRPKNSTWSTQKSNSIHMKAVGAYAEIGAQRICMTDSNQDIEYQTASETDTIRIDVEGYIINIR